MAGSAVPRGSSPTAAAANGAASRGAIVGLYARYPETLSLLKEGWWHNDSHLETLSALAVWRHWIDDAGRDPREELAFQAQLANYGHALRQEGGSIINKWQPGAPPVE